MPSLSTDSPWTDAHRDRILSWVDKWRGMLLLNGHQIQVVFAETPDPDRPDCAASMTPNNPYMSGHRLTCWSHFLDTTDHKEQERRIIHELVQIRTQPMKALIGEVLRDKMVTWRNVEDEDERLTDWIANVIQAIHARRDE